MMARKNRIGSIDKSFHFLGIDYPGTQPQDGANVTQAQCGSVVQCCIITQQLH
jgi:hypothetical protein